MPVPNVTSRRPRPGRATHHFKTFREMPRNTKANEIADKMGVRRIRSESLCRVAISRCSRRTTGRSRSRASPANPVTAPGRIGSRSTAGSAARHTLFESKAEEKARWKLADSKGNDQAALVLPAGEELLRLPRRAARGPRQQRRPQGRQRLRSGVLVAGRGAAQHLVFQGQGKRAGQRGPQADALSRRPRRRARDRHCARSARRP